MALRGYIIQYYKCYRVTSGEGGYSGEREKKVEEAKKRVLYSSTCDFAAYNQQIELHISRDIHLSGRSPRDLHRCRRDWPNRWGCQE